MQLLLRAEWFDPRLKFSDNSVKRIEGDSWYLRRIWYPAFHVPNNKEPGALEDFNDGTALVRILPNGSVMMRKRYIMI